MTAARKGLLHGNTITLETTVPPFEGQRVHVLLNRSRRGSSSPLRSWPSSGGSGPREASGPIPPRTLSSLDPSRRYRWFRFNTPDKRRPVVVLGHDRLLPSLSQVPVIPLSTQIRGLSWEVAAIPRGGVTFSLCPEAGVDPVCPAFAPRAFDRQLSGYTLGGSPYRLTPSSRPRDLLSGCCSLAELEGKKG